MAVKKQVIDCSKVKFAENGLIPVIAQDYESGEVLLLAYMNQEALEKSFQTEYAHYYSRSKKTVSKYGTATNSTQKIVTAFLDNDNDTLLIKVRQSGNANPEQNAYTCFPTQIKGEYKDIGGEMFGRLQRIIAEYKKNPEDGTYTSYLLAKGADRIAKKVGEEAVEFVIASKNPDKDGIVYEAADLLYHTMVLLSAKEIKISQVCSELCKRNR